jgi:hypothetical protein
VGRARDNCGVVLMAVCGLLVVAGLAVVAVWGGRSFEAPSPAAATLGQRYLWNVTVAVGSGVGAGLLIAGAGGRLVMRLLAVTAGDVAQGRVTEADEVVGRVTTGGTIGFIVFTALFFGVATGFVYALVRRWLPAGRLGGLAYGALLLLVAATRIEPLRADNPDFDLVGPSWVALLAFAALVLSHGMLVAALAARYSQALVPLSADVTVVLRYTPLLLLVPVFPALAVLGVGGLVWIAINNAVDHGPAAGDVSHRALVVGRTVLLLAAGGMLPGFVSAVVDIAGRGP